MNADQVRATYRRGAEHAVQIRRYIPPDSVLLTEDATAVITTEDDYYLGFSEPLYRDYATKAKLVGLGTEQLMAEGVAQYAMRAIILTDGLVANHFVLPVTSNDKLLWNNREWAIEVPDGATRYTGDALIAYQLMIRG